eukprot:CAMPEP_0119033624 /NCGR_PEP_ID=MMETSP1177-20130426/675_1 /TAXON_ID=2985 /ORGANISM="Ochromonas sp, Strain CCMP1899" /LENGTH=444 /DNA_ID=CAMNT_0006990509 /DNA_START=103 /DNA_END=1434 /DNA_ORIENTATION=+
MSGLIETKKDYTADVAVIIPESITLADERGLDEAILLLLGMEKKCRVNNDFSNLKEICLHMVRLCRTKGDWSRLNSTLAVINKRRSQSKVAISAIVEEAVKYIEETPSLEVKIELIKTLKDICEGKMYVEGQSASLHLSLALIMEEGGDISGATDMIQDVHVETYGSLSKKEKAEYILQQIRLNLLKKDYVRALIQSRKMNRKVLEEEGMDEIKIKYYTMMVEYHTIQKESWDICQSYYKIYDTASTREDPVALQDAFESSVIFLLLSKFDNHQSDMSHRLKQLLVKESETSLVLPFQLHPVYLHVLILFTTKEIIPFPFEGQPTLEAHACFTRHSSSLGETKEAVLPVGKEYWLKELHGRVIQHNLRIVSEYYTRICTSRLATMVGLTTDELEQQLSHLSEDSMGVSTPETAVGANMYVKIDRPAGIIRFDRTRAPESVLSDW